MGKIIEESNSKKIAHPIILKVLLNVYFREEAFIFNGLQLMVSSI